MLFVRRPFYFVAVYRAPCTSHVSVFVCVCVFCYLENWAWLWMHPFCTISFHVFISMRSFSGEQNTIEAPSLHLFIFILFRLFFALSPSLHLPLPRLSFLFLRLFGDAYFNGFKIFRIWIFRNFHSNCLPFSLASGSKFIHDLIRSSFALGWAAIELEMCMRYALRE